MTPQEALHRALSLLQRLLDHEHGLAHALARKDAEALLGEVDRG